MDLNYIAHLHFDDEIVTMKGKFKMPTVIGRTAYTKLAMQLDRLKSTHTKREKKITGLEKKLQGLKPVDLRAGERRKRTKARKLSRR